MATKINTQLATALWENGLLDKEIAEQMGRAAKSIGNWRQRHGMPSNRDIFLWDRGERDPREINRAIREVR